MDGGRRADGTGFHPMHPSKLVPEWAQARLTRSDGEVLSRRPRLRGQDFRPDSPSDRRAEAWAEASARSLAPCCRLATSAASPVRGPARPGRPCVSASSKPASSPFVPPRPHLAPAGTGSDSATMVYTKVILVWAAIRVEYFNWNRDRCMYRVHTGMYQVCTGMYHALVWYRYKPT